eukprot:GHVS01014425.1.p1 GENE.GHVS01014425.1~~GHVS01014425.1.p1  ORF type:complete len:573 (+),score=121.28 GHVS01014425.1:359-2077(+)
MNPSPPTPTSGVPAGSLDGTQSGGSHRTPTPASYPLSPLSCPASPGTFASPPPPLPLPSSRVLLDLPAAARALSEVAPPSLFGAAADKTKGGLVSVAFRVTIGGCCGVTVDVGQQEQVAIVGNCGSLGNWNTKQPLCLQLWWKPASPCASAENRSSCCWVSPTVFLEREDFAELEFKCVVLRPLDRNQSISWETFGPHVFENRHLSRGVQEPRDDEVRVVRMEFGKKGVAVDKIVVPGHRSIHAVPSLVLPGCRKLGGPSRLTSDSPFAVANPMGVPCADLLTNKKTVQRNQLGELTGGSVMIDNEAYPWIPGEGETDDKAAKDEEPSNEEDDTASRNEPKAERMAATTTSGSALSMSTKGVKGDDELDEAMMKEERNGGKKERLWRLLVAFVMCSKRRERPRETRSIVELASRGKGEGGKEGEGTTNGGGGNEGTVWTTNDEEEAIRGAGVNENDEDGEACVAEEEDDIEEEQFNVDWDEHREDTETDEQDEVEAVEEQGSRQHANPQSQDHNPTCSWRHSTRRSLHYHNNKARAPDGPSVSLGFAAMIAGLVAAAGQWIYRDWADLDKRD